MNEKDLKSLQVFFPSEDLSTLTDDELDAKARRFFLEGPRETLVQALAFLAQTVAETQGALNTQALRLEYYPKLAEAQAALVSSLCDALGCDAAEFVRHAVGKETERWVALLQGEPSRALAEARTLFKSVAPRPN
jgi:hypothetical protein